MLRRNIPCIAILTAYILCIVAVNPAGEFPLNDDWSYTRSAFAFGAGHGLKVDPWSAPSLIGQAIYGGLLARLFSQEFIVLRLSTLALSCCTLLLIWVIFLRLGVDKKVASLLLLSWAFNPLQFSLSFTFMTEIPFIFCIAAALSLYVLHLDSGKYRYLLLSSTVLGYAFLIRQTALLFILALLCSLFLDGHKPVWTKIRQTIPIILISVIIIGGYYLWSHMSGGATAAVHRKFDLLNRLKVRQLVGNSYGMLFYISFMLMPLWALLIPNALGTMSRFPRRLRIGIPAVCFVITAVGLWWFNARYMHWDYLPAASYHSRMPYLLNILYDTGLGPLTLDPDYFAPPPAPSYPGLWSIVTGIVAVGAVVLLMLTLFGLLRIRERFGRGKFSPVTVFGAAAVCLLASFEVVFSHLQEGGLFDRHILIVAFPLLFMGWVSKPGAAQEIEDSSIPRRLWRVIPRVHSYVPVFAIIMLATFSVAATHDYLQWNRIRWELGRRLLSEGVDPLSIVGGFEFNAWNNYDTFVARGRTAQVSHWWYDRRNYIITMIKLDGYDVRQARSYFSWVHQRPIHIYVIADCRLPIAK